MDRLQPDSCSNMPVKTSEQYRAAARASGLLLPRQSPCPAGEHFRRPFAHSASTHDPMVGLTLGQYRILEKLGAGGMGQVYQAEHLLMKRRVALKIVTGQPSGNEAAEAGSLFRREVQAAAQLWHPNIVPNLLAAMERAGVAPKRVMVEITESAAMVDPTEPCRS